MPGESDPTQRREKRGRENKKGKNKHIQMPEYSVTLAGGYQALLTDRLLLQQHGRASCSPMAQRRGAWNFAWWASRSHSQVANQSRLPDWPSPTVALLIHFASEPPMMLAVNNGTAVTVNMGHLVCRRPWTGQCPSPCAIASSNDFSLPELIL